MYTAAILTVSDKGAAGLREDESGKVISQMLTEMGYDLRYTAIVADEFDQIVGELKHMCDSLKANLVLTTGGTGFSPRDITPEATSAIIERSVPGIPAAIMQNSLKITPRAMLSRAACGIRGCSLVLNLPGSPKAVRESLEYVLPVLAHGLDILTGNDSECAR